MCINCFQSGLTVAESAGLSPATSKFLALGSAAVLLFSLSTPLTVSTKNIKSGASCTKQNQIKKVSGKTFVCKLDGKKLVWRIKPQLQTSTKPGVTAPVAPAPPPIPEVQLPNENSTCSVLGAKVSNSTGAMRCSWTGHSNTTTESNQRFKWLKHVEFKVSTSQSNNYTTTPVENASCTNSGDTYDVTGGKLECRWVAGKKLQWIKINTIKKTFTNAKSPVSIDVCKLQMSASKADRTGRNSGAGQVGFPMVNSDKNGMFINGTNEVLIVPVDFSDFPGGPELKAQLEYDKKMLVDWYDYFSGGKSKFNVTTIDQWLRLPKPRSEYPTDEKSKNALGEDSNKRQSLQAQNFIDEVTKFIDLRKFSTVYLFFPDGNYEQGDLIVRNQPFTIKEGQKNLNFFS